jgi:peptidoglycan hydrolase CwlO-like protein
MKQVCSIAVVVLLVGVICQSACVNVRTPDVRINAGPPPEKVDSKRVPATSSHEEARAELEKAYRQIRYLEDQNRRLAEKVEKEKSRAKEYEEKYERLKDKYDD